MVDIKTIEGDANITKKAAIVTMLDKLNKMDRRLLKMLLPILKLLLLEVEKCVRRPEVA